MALDLAASLLFSNCQSIICGNYWARFNTITMLFQLLAQIKHNYVFCESVDLSLWIMLFCAPKLFVWTVLSWHFYAFCRQKLALVLQHYQWLVTYLLFCIFFIYSCYYHLDLIVLNRLN